MNWGKELPAGLSDSKTANYGKLSYDFCLQFLFFKMQTLKKLLPINFAEWPERKPKANMAIF